ncbi:putative ankyrin repeat-containing domain, PGG domain, ankyrin repeat-containing domain superfamily [Helianthus annuus]|nr:putative ankyrin repeat-containing domain, PGG domain, ankyrin repeat-containing domain superfamily [Helianthus annuus]
MQKHKNSIDDILKGPMTVVEKSKDEKIETYPSPILSTATDMNNTQFLVELIREYRDIMWKKNDDGQTMFHIAVAHRSRDVYTLLLDEIGPKKKDLNLITPITDNQGNNILHLVGKYPKNIDEVPAPFKMHTEILWYKEVEGMLPPLYRQVKNKGGRTPHEQFTIGHKRLLADAMKWIYDTINLSMVISALVCTIGFSVVYSVPGGFDQKNGSPILFRSRYFIAFIAMVAFSFILSSSSILIFLSVILPARNQKNSEVLLKKWVIGQVALSSSVSVMIFAFVFGFSILYINVDESSLYIFYVGAIVLMYIYITMHFPLFKDLLMSIYLPGYLFRPSLRMKIKPVP